MAGNGSELTVVEPNRMQPTVRENRPLTVEEVIARSKLVKRVLAEVMEKGKHYDTIPGCGKKACLLQAGAQQLGVTFGMFPDQTIVNMVDTPEEYMVAVKVSLYGASGICFGSSIGVCSSMEDKYHWRKIICDAEFNDTPENKRREKWKKGYRDNPAYKEKQVMVSPKDIANTVTKMAIKRGYVGAMITATAASDQFTQDLDDMQKELLQDDDEGNGQTEKARSTQKEKPKNDQQRQQAAKQVMATIRGVCGNDAKKVADILQEFFPKGINDCPLDDILRARVAINAKYSMAPSAEQPPDQPPNKPAGNGKEAGFRKQIVAKLTTMLKTEDAVNKWLESEMNTSISGMDKLDDGQLFMILEAVDEKFKEFTKKV